MVSPIEEARGCQFRLRCAMVDVSSNFAMPLTRFIGRARDLVELGTILDRGERLVTLTGMGGIGKTRLAMEMAAVVAELGRAEVRLTELAPLDSLELVEMAVLESIGGRLQSGASALDAIVEQLGTARTLLVLDCCEHVLDAASRTAESLLGRCPALTVLATSRAPLGVAGELALTVPPLSMQKQIDEVSDAASLFLERASRNQPLVDLEDDVISAAETIVRRVEGIPLAIELAAARARLLSLGEIADGLADHLQMLSGGVRRADPRHRTMRASLDWSHALLADRERTLFARLAVFSGGFDLEAAIAVCAAPPIGPGHMLDEVAALVDKSLIWVRPGPGTTRFGMVDFVRQYAAERLAASGEQALMAANQRAYFRDLASRSDQELWALTDAGRTRLDDESPNLRAAIDDACAHAPEDALTIVGALGLYWRERGRLSEGMAAIEQSLAAAQATSSTARAMAFSRLAMLAFWRGDLGCALEATNAAAALGTIAGDPRSLARALGLQGILTTMTDPPAAQSVLQQAADLARTGWDDSALADVLTVQAINFLFQDDHVALSEAIDDALQVAEGIGFDDDVRWCLWCAAQAALTAGDIAEARAVCERALALEGDNDPFGRDFVVQILAIIEAVTGAPARARQRVEAAFERSKLEVVRLGVGALMHALGVAALAAGDVTEARRWAGLLYEEQGGVNGYLAWNAQAILASAALAEENSAGAKLHADMVLTVSERLNNPRAAAVASLSLARALLLEGDDPQAESFGYKALAVLEDHGWRLSEIDAIELLGVIALRQGRHERGARLLGAAQEARRSSGVVAFPFEREWTERHLELAQKEFDTEALALALEDGSRMTLEAAASYAQRGRGERARATRGWASLSRVERQVVDLAVQGLTNPKIAGQLFMSRGTVKAHLSHAFAKLGVANRTELARVAPPATRPDPSL
jgi:predicted ATPase/DNA-binding CsgD family transcriptional regulator